MLSFFLFICLEVLISVCTRRGELGEGEETGLVQELLLESATLGVEGSESVRSNCSIINSRGR